MDGEIEKRATFKQLGASQTKFVINSGDSSSSRVSDTFVPPPVSEPREAILRLDPDALAAINEAIEKKQTVIVENSFSPRLSLDQVAIETMARFYKVPQIEVKAPQVEVKPADIRVSAPEVRIDPHYEFKINPLISEEEFRRFLRSIYTLQVTQFVIFVILLILLFAMKEADRFMLP